MAFTQGQIGATYTVAVSDQSGAGPTSGTVTVTEMLPLGLTLVSMAGTGWTCPGGNTCTRSDVLNSGASYPAIAVTVNVAAGAPSSVTNQASVSGNGAATATASDITLITSLPGQVTLTSPGSGATSQSRTPTLSWAAASNATSYDLYLGSSSSPPVYVQNLSGASYTVSTALNAGTTYYWNVVAKNSAGSAPASGTWSFTTAASGGPCQSGTQAFTTNTTWTVPGGCTSAILEAIGGGGGGQAGYLSQGAGGGGGGYSTATVTTSPGTVYTLTVGAGGGGGALSQPSGAGGDSYVQLSGVEQVRGHGGQGGSGGQPVTVTFNSNTTWTVPSGVSNVTIKAYGAGGGNGGANIYPDYGAYGGGNGGAGGYAQGSVNVTGGSSLTVAVGLAGSNGGDNFDYGGTGGAGRAGGASTVSNGGTVLERGLGGQGGAGGVGLQSLAVDGASGGYQITGSNTLGISGGGGGSGNNGWVSITYTLGVSGGGSGGGGSQAGGAGGNAGSGGGGGGGAGTAGSAGTNGSSSGVGGNFGGGAGGTVSPGIGAAGIAPGGGGGGGATTPGIYAGAAAPVGTGWSESRGIKPWNPSFSGLTATFWKIRRGSWQNPMAAQHGQAESPQLHGFRRPSIRTRLQQKPLDAAGIDRNAAASKYLKSPYQRLIPVALSRVPHQPHGMNGPRGRPPRLGVG